MLSVRLPANSRLLVQLALHIRGFLTTNQSFVFNLQFVESYNMKPMDMKGWLQLSLGGVKTYTDF